MKTMIVVLLDRSGSMGALEAEVVSGVNSFLEEQRAIKQPASLAMVRFDSEAIERFRPMIPLENVSALDRRDFKARSWTPLLDAVGKSITEMEDDWRRERPDQAIMVIATDGQENASREFTKEKVRALIEARQSSGKWAFIYLGANVDVFAEAGSMGIMVENSAGYNATPAGVRSMYSSASATVGAMRSTGKLVADNLGGKIEDHGGVTRTSPPGHVSGAGSAAPAVLTWTPPAPAAGTAVWTPPSQ